MITKHQIPLNMLKAIEGIAQNNLDIIRFVKEENTYYSFWELNTDSDNFFRIYIDGSKIIGTYQHKNFAYSWKPKNEAEASTYKYQGNIDDVTKQFEVWVKLIRDIHDTPSLHDDNFTKLYSDFYFEEFKIVDGDANTAPFNPDQQDLIELYLLSLTNAIENNNEQILENVKEDLLSEIKQIGSNLVTSTKTKVMKDITKIFGKLHKVSRTFAKEVIIEARRGLIKKLIELGIQYGPKILEAFKQQF